jgi:hypothetical protein
MIQSVRNKIICKKIDTDVVITLHHLEDPKKGIKTEGKMEDCDSTNKCGVLSNSGSYDWAKCPNFQKSLKEIVNG